MNIEQHDATMNPVVWIEDFLLHIHMARGDDLHAIKYLPLKLKGLAQEWLNNLPKILSEVGKSLNKPSCLIFAEPVSDHRTPPT